jgi:hypothetical protein
MDMPKDLIVPVAIGSVAVILSGAIIYLLVGEHRPTKAEFDALTNINASIAFASGVGPACGYDVKAWTQEASLLRDHFSLSDDQRTTLIHNFATGRAYGASLGAKAAGSSDLCGKLKSMAASAMAQAEMLRAR